MDADYGQHLRMRSVCALRFALAVLGCGYAALDGNMSISPTLAGEVLREMKSGLAQPADPVAALTPRQREILQLVAEGRSTKEIGSQLDISPRTVEFHKYQLMNAQARKQRGVDSLHHQERNRFDLMGSLLPSRSVRVPTK